MLDRGRLPLLAVLLLVCTLLDCTPAAGPPPSAPSPLLDQPLPRITRRALDGSSIDTAALRGQVVVIKFFAKYCEPCKQTLPAAERLHQERPDIAIIGVAEDERESDVRATIWTYRLTFPVIRDQRNMLAGRFRVADLPITFVADARGTVRWVGGPEQDEADLQRAVDAIW
jgi:cytochrome c biogenesis protein CcmG/thiol:disulfide interchange protein DsbE